MQYLVIGSNLGQVKKQKQKEKRNRPTMEYLLLSNLLFCFCFVSIKLGILRFFSGGCMQYAPFIAVCCLKIEKSNELNVKYLPIFGSEKVFFNYLLMVSLMPMY